MLSSDARKQKPRNAFDMIGRTLTRWEKIKLRWHYAGPWRYLDCLLRGLVRLVYVLPLAVPMIALSLVYTVVEWVLDHVLEPVRKRWFELGDKLVPNRLPTQVPRGWDCIKDRRFMDALVKSDLITADERHELEELWK